MSIHLQRAIAWAILAVICAVLQEPFGACAFAFLAFVGVLADRLDRPKKDHLLPRR